MAAASLEGRLLKNVAWILCLCGLLALPLAAGAAPATSTPSNNGRVLYKWVDKDGVTHYGDHVPPEYATQEQHILNSQGYEIRHLDAQKTAEQEIERLRDQRLTLLADQIKVTNQFLDTLNGRMKKMRTDSMRFKPYNSDPKAPSMPDQMAEDLVRLASDMRTQEQNLKQKHSEEAAMSIQFESDIDRFKELKHIQ